MAQKNKPGLKSALDLALERLSKDEGPITALSDKQKKAIAEIESQAKARMAEIEILTGKRIAEAREKGDPEEVKKIEEQKATDLGRIRERTEREKQQVRTGGK